MTTSQSIVRASARRNPSHRRIDIRNIRMATGIVYVASPLSTYETNRYDDLLGRLQQVMPKADLLPARACFSSKADWRRRWPSVLPTLDAVVFFDDEDGCIGAGTEKEIADAYRSGIPVLFLNTIPFDTLIPCDASGTVEFLPVFGRGMKQTQRVCVAISIDDAFAMLRHASKGGA